MQDWPSFHQNFWGFSTVHFLPQRSWLFFFHGFFHHFPPQWPQMTLKKRGPGAPFSVANPIPISDHDTSWRQNLWRFPRRHRATPIFIQGSHGWPWRLVLKQAWWLGIPFEVGTWCNPFLHRGFMVSKTYRKPCCRSGKKLVSSKWTHDLGKTAGSSSTG